MKKVVTHNGPFQADDICAVATLFLLMGEENIELVRSRDQAVIDTGDIVVDVGAEHDPARGRFDHHQEGGAGGRPNGAPYSAFGLVWKQFGPELCQKYIEQEGGDASGAAAAFARVDEGLVQLVDMNDVGIDFVSERDPRVSSYTLDDIAHAFHATWKEDWTELDRRFLMLAQLAKVLIEREIIKAVHHFLSDTAVRDAYEHAADKRVIVLDKPYSAEALADFPEPLYVIKPRPSDGSWNIKAINDRGARFANRKSMPASWSGKRDAELQKISGVPDALFCHLGLWTAAAKSREGAVALATIAANA